MRIFVGNNNFYVINEDGLWIKGKGLPQITPVVAPILLPSNDFRQLPLIELGLPPDIKPEDIIDLGDIFITIEGDLLHLFFYVFTKKGLYTAGTNRYGETGHGHNTPVTSLTLVQSLNDKNIVKIAYSGSTTFAITTEGTVLATGKNGYGQLGLPHNDIVTDFKEVPFKEGVIEIACSETLTLIQTSKKKLYATGLNNVNQLGFKHKNDINTFTEVTSVVNIVDMAAKADCSILKTVEGKFHYAGGFYSKSIYQLNIDAQLNIIAFNTVFCLSYTGELYKINTGNTKESEVSLEKIEIPEPVIEARFFDDKCIARSMTDKVYMISLSGGKYEVSFSSIISALPTLKLSAATAYKKQLAQQNFNPFAPRSFSNIRARMGESLARELFSPMLIGCKECDTFLKPNVDGNCPYCTARHHL